MYTDVHAAYGMTKGWDFFDDYSVRIPPLEWDALECNMIFFLFHFISFHLIASSQEFFSVCNMLNRDVVYYTFRFMRVLHHHFNWVKKINNNRRKWMQNNNNIEKIECETWHRTSAFMVEKYSKAFACSCSLSPAFILLSFPHSLSCLYAYVSSYRLLFHFTLLHNLVIVSTLSIHPKIVLHRRQWRWWRRRRRRQWQWWWRFYSS